MTMTGADDRALAARQTIGQIALVVRDYDEAIDFMLACSDFALVEDSVGPGPGQTLGRRGAAGLDRLKPASGTGRGR